MRVLIRGAGDIATGVALRLYRSHMEVVMTDLPAPTAIRRTVCFSQAIVLGRTVVEDVTAAHAANAAEAEALLAGMTIDTNGFSVKTGVRTFEAAAWLRRQGADPTEVKRFFQEEISNIKLRAEAVLSAQVFEIDVVEVFSCPSHNRSVLSFGKDTRANIAIPPFSYFRNSSTFRSRSSSSASSVRGQAIFSRMKPAPAAPYIVPELTRSLPSASRRSASSSDASPAARQSAHTR